MNAPRAKGIKRRKENLAALFFSTPANIPEEIVIPDLETPGKRAIIWNRPIRSELVLFSFFSPEVYFVKKRTIPVKKKANDKNRYEVNAASIISLKR